MQHFYIFTSLLYALLPHPTFPLPTYSFRDYASATSGGCIPGLELSLLYYFTVIKLFTLCGELGGQGKCLTDVGKGEVHHRVGESVVSFLFHPLRSFFNLFHLSIVRCSFLSSIHCSPILIICAFSSFRCALFFFFFRAFCVFVILLNICFLRLFNNMTRQ